MRGVPIKFRGIDEDGNFHYGDYVTRENGCAIRFKEKKTLIKIYVYEVTVKPESVTQLVGYDAEGKEIYDGDKIWDKYGNVAIATVNTNYDLPSFYLYPKEYSNG